MSILANRAKALNIRSFSPGVEVIHGAGAKVLEVDSKGVKGPDGKSPKPAPVSAGRVAQGGQPAVSAGPAIAGEVVPESIVDSWPAYARRIQASAAQLGTEAAQFAGMCAFYARMDCPTVMADELLAFVQNSASLQVSCFGERASGLAARLGAAMHVSAPAGDFDAALGECVQAMLANPDRQKLVDRGARAKDSKQESAKSILAPMASRASRITPRTDEAGALADACSQYANAPEPEAYLPVLTMVSEDRAVLSPGNREHLKEMLLNGLSWTASDSVRHTAVKEVFLTAQAIQRARSKQLVDALPEPRWVFPVPSKADARG